MENLAGTWRWEPRIQRIVSVEGTELNAVYCIQLAWLIETIHFLTEFRLEFNSLIFHSSGEEMGEGGIKTRFSSSLEVMLTGFLNTALRSNVLLSFCSRIYSDNLLFDFVLYSFPLVPRKSCSLSFHVV